MRKPIVFRFDIDSERCLTEGVPQLLRLADQKQVRFSFFVNMGRAIDLPHSIRAALSPKQKALEAPSAPFLPARRKLGLKGFIRTLLLNPQVGARHLDIVRSIQTNGHEIALHGGRNHAEWVNQVGTWPEAKIKDELTWGLQHLQEVIGSQPIGFGSPGWKNSPALFPMLHRLGFKYVSDLSDPAAIHIFKTAEGLPHIPVTILGNPGGVAYFEYLVAKGLTKAQAIADFETHLNASQAFAVTYDHPYFAGIEGLPLLEAAIQKCKELDFDVLRMADLLDSHSS